MPLSDSLLRPPFVGRRAELNALRAIADSVVSTTEARTVFLLGDAGIGKTRLVEEFLESLNADWAKYIVFCDAEDPPYGPALALLDQLEPGAAEPPDDLADVGEVVADRVAAISAANPVLVVVENADVAGDSTFDTLAQAVLDLGRVERVLLLVTFRTGALSAATEARRAQLFRLQREFSSSTIVLEGLTEHEVVALLDAIGYQPAPQLSAQLLREQSDGNPLHLIRSARSADIPGIGVSGAESDFERVIAEIADRLPYDEQRLLALATIIAPEIDSLGLAAVAGINLEEAAAALVRASDAGVLRPAARGYAFGHPLLRDYFSKNLGRFGVDVEGVHAAFAGYLATEAGDRPSPRQVSRIARHLLDAGSWADTELVARFAARGARVAADSGEWLNAGRLWDLAVRHTTPGSLDRLDALLGAGIAYARSGDPERSATLLGEAENLARSLDDPDRLTDILTHRLQLLGSHVKDRDRAAAPEEALIAAMSTNGVMPATMARARSTLAQQHFENGRNVEALAEGERAVAAANASHDDGALGHARFALGVAQLSSLQSLQALENFRSSFEAFERSPDRWYRTWPTGRIPLALWLLGRLGAAEHEATRAAIEAVNAHNWGGYEIAMAARAGVRAAKGDFAAAESDVYNALLASSVSQYAWPPRIALPVLAYIRSCLGDDAGADEAVDRFRSVVGQSASWDLEVLVLLLRGETGRVHRLRIDDPRRANRRWSPSMVSLGPLTLANEAAVLLGNVEACTANLPLLQEAATQGNELSLGWNSSLSRGIGAAATVCRDWDMAEHYLQQSIERCTKEGALPELARAHLDLGELIRARDGSPGRRAAMEHVEQAEQHFARLGMPRHVRWARTLASHLGESLPSTAPQDSRDSSPLTSRETEVIRAVGQGLTNREVADLLVIQLPTVQRHLANIFSKLGVRNRVAAVNFYNNHLRNH